jgi:hypothetical protein
VDTEQIENEAQAIEKATNHLLRNMPDEMYPGGIAKWYPEARCRYVTWTPATDKYMVFVSGVTNTALANYLLNKLCAAGHQVFVVATAW